MKKPRKVIFIVISSLMIIVILYLFSGPFFGVDLYRAITLKARINKIIYKTDHQALLTASRILIKEGYRGQYNFGWVDRHPDVDKFPKEIHDLKPVSVYVLDDEVFIELLGGLSSCRLVAYSDDFNEPIYGEKKLIDGLWLESDLMDFK